MAFQLSPGVLVQEQDLTHIVPAVATTPGGFAGVFNWGPVDEIINISSQNELVETFQKQDDNTFSSFFTEANFLDYGSNLQVVRVATGNLNSSASGSGILVKNTTDWTTKTSALSSGNHFYIGRYPGTLGNSIRVSQCQNAAAFSTSNVTTTTQNNSAGATSVVVVAGNTLAIGDLITFAGHTTKYEITNIATNTLTIREKGKTTGLTVAVDGSSTPVQVSREWYYADQFDAAPGTSAQATARSGSGDEIHLIVVDEDGLWTGTAGTILEKYSNLSVASDAKSSNGSVNFYKEVVYAQSEYIFWGKHHTSLDADVGAAAGTLGNAFSHATNLPMYSSLAGGTDDNAPTDGELQTGFAKFANDEAVDVSLIPTGAVSATVSKYVVENVAEVRKDCMVFISPELADAQSSTPATDIKDFRTTQNINSSFAVMDSGYKYQFDRYNDVFRYVPLNGDVAGCLVRTDLVADPFFSPAGFNRGQIKNAVKLAYSPDKADRDTLYKNAINPVVSFPGQGTVLFGDKTMLSAPSAFDRINVRRLFIILEKAIATAAKFQLFEFNDTFTRANFRNLVEPFLRDIQGRRGLTDFKVVCDTTNNTAAVIDANEFRADIFVKPARSINFITLKFVATRTGISFEETGV